MSEDLKRIIEAAWEARDGVNTGTRGEIRDAVRETLDQLDSGVLRVASRGDDGVWTTHQWAKQAILLSFRLNPNELMEGDAPGPYWDKVPSKFAGWDAARFEAAGFRAVPGAVARRGAFIARNVVLMPSFVNIGAYVDEGTMVDGWATVGSCAQIGKNVHLGRRGHRRGAGTAAGQSHDHRRQLLHRRALRGRRGCDRT